MRLRHFALPAAAGLTLLAIPFAPAAVAATAPVCEDNACTVGFDYTGAPESFTVPAGVSNLAVALVGAQGGDGFAGDGSRSGPAAGLGGAQLAIVPVTPGEVLTVVVGGRGGDAVDYDDVQDPLPPAAAGGYGGGGAGTPGVNGPSAGGGGGTFLYGSGGLLLAVGGGGGAGYTGVFTTSPADGGNGGGSADGVAAAGSYGGGGATTAGGGTPGGGAGGTGGTGPASSPSAFGTGGAGADTCFSGGGGGGYYGGGSGGCETNAPISGTDAQARAAVEVTNVYGAGGGGGGAGFTGTGVSTVEGSSTSIATDSGNGVAALSYTTAATNTTLATQATQLAPGQETSLTATVTGPSLQIADDEAAATKAAAAAAGYGDAQAKALAVPNQPAAPGSTITPGTACGTTPCTVTFFVNGVALGDPITVDPTTGKATVVFTAGSEQGVRNIVARYDGNLYYLQSSSNTVAITVSGLANTGPSNVEPMIVAAAGLLVAGAGLVAFGRRRPQLGAHRAA